ncbi:TonB-dependent receptor [Luteimonas sp. BDR2-5]|uniref:TonB-dependent receptor n=1 Tax=Proluteimonas luteida TaxID=2878685 RepID=UPI001E59C128|nr:TonB-dependent receptor [Luteimonas sp. BDR2-5]MCD9026775.1 TonB-dependent receptor [Luteimonas sp. BDR2-5]
MGNRRVRFGRHGYSFAYGALAMSIIASLPTHTAQAQPAPSADAIYDFDLPAGELGTVLQRFSATTGLQVSFQPGLAEGQQVGAIRGRLAWQAVLTRLLQGTGLEYQVVNSKAIVIRRAEAPPAPAARPQSPPSPPAARAATADTPTTDLERLMVTGTRIRGGSTPSPVIEIGAERILQEGFADLGEVIRSTPQNYNGGQNPGMAGGSTNAADQNLTGGSALNLRGLGADASLTLLNGRRLAYSGFSQAVDIGAIPVDAVERLEIIPDGASAIYGSDAVGGVANVILRRDFDGVVLGTRHGAAADGGLSTHEYTVTSGATWSNGGLIATYKNVSVDPIYGRQRDYTALLPDPYTIYFGNKMSASVISAHHEVGAAAELRLDVLKTDREMSRELTGIGSYDRQVTETSIVLASPGVEIFLPGDWSLDLGATYGTGETISDRRVGDGTTTDLPRGNVQCFCNESRTYEIGAEGPLFSLSGGDARLALGLGSRKNSFLTRRIHPSPSTTGGEERARYGYAELSLPIISPDSNMSGVHRLELSGAARSEDYDTFGRVNTPKLGLVYGPSSDFTLKASWGKSFKAPTLNQRYERKVSYLLGVELAGGSGYPPGATALMSGGGNSELQAERARTWTASLALHPDAWPSLQAELTWFDIDFADRVVLPVNIYQTLSNPMYAEFVNYSPTPEQQAALLAEYNSAFFNLAGAPYDPSQVVAIVRADYTNVARQRVQGIDLSGSYRIDLDKGRLVVRGSASWLDSSQQTSAAQPAFDLAGEAFQPAKFNGRLGLVWTDAGISVSGFMNHIAGVTNRQATFTEKTASFTTVDSTLRYRTGDRSDALGGVEVAIAIQNLLNRAPPLYTPLSVVQPPFDSSNYSAVGRFWSVSISKRW